MTVNDFEFQEPTREPLSIEDTLKHLGQICRHMIYGRVSNNVRFRNCINDVHFCSGELQTRDRADVPTRVRRSGGDWFNRLVDVVTEAFLTEANRARSIGTDKLWHRGYTESLRAIAFYGLLEKAIEGLRLNYGDDELACVEFSPDWCAERALEIAESDHWEMPESRRYQ